MKRLIFVALTALTMAASCGKPEAGLDALRRNFADPPEESRPMVWWHWMDGNITKEGIRKDLEWMKRSGIRGFQMFDAALYTERIVDHRLVYMTPEWKDAFRYALDLADSLGLEVGIASSPGWSHTGGPWVKPEDAMKKLVWKDIVIDGGRDFEGEIPAPESDYPYGDIAVLALKIPDEDRILVPASVRTSGGKADPASLSDGDPKTGFDLYPSAEGVCRVTYSFREPVTARSLFLSASVEHTDFKLLADGKPVCTVRPAAEATVSFPAVEARTFSLETRLVPPGVILKLLGLEAKDHVSLGEFRLGGASRINLAEAKSGSTTMENLAQFQTAEDGLDHAAEAIDITDHFHDGRLAWSVPEGRWRVYRFGWTLTGKQNSPAPAEATGLEVDKLDPAAWKSYIETYLDMYQEAAGGSLDKIDYLLTDSWEAGCENWTPRMREEFRARRGYDPLPWFPALAGDIVGSSSSSEKFLLDWRVTLAELVAENFDRLTDLVKERGLKGRYGESHEGGRAFVADGMDVKRKATVPMSAIWAPGSIVGSTLENSLADMRESSSVSHIYGQRYVAAESMTAVGLFGYAYSFYPGNLKPIADNEFASGVNRIVIHESAHQPRNDKFPGVCLSITGQWFNRHETWAEQAKPWTDYLARSSYMLQQGRNVADLLVLYGDDTNITARYGHGEMDGFPKGYNFDFVNPYALANVIRYEKGRFVAPSGNSWRVLALDADSCPDALKERIEDWKAQGARIVKLSELSMDGIPADVITDGDVRFVHRSVKGGEFYWVSSPSDGYASMDLSLRASGRHVSVWDPETGSVSPCRFEVVGGRTLVHWEAQPHDAKFFVISDRSMAEGEPAGEPRAVGEKRLDGPWKVRFQEGRGAPAEAVFDTLRSFTESAEPGIRYFSGTASYGIDFDFKPSGKKVVLSLGDVENIAEVIMNGRSVRTLWKVPYEADVTDAVRDGENHLEIRVTDLWPNRLIGDAGLPADERITYEGYPFYSAGDPLRPAGLLGPVRVIDEN